MSAIDGVSEIFDADAWDPVPGFDDLTDLIIDQLQRPRAWDGKTVNVGGGPECSLSLCETTKICEEMTGNHLDVARTDVNRAGDVRIDLSDCARLHGHTSWRPRRGPRRILEDILSWVHANEGPVRAALG